MPPRKRLLLFLLIGLLTVTISVIPDLVSDELKAWYLQHFGPSYPWYFIGFLVVGCFVVLAMSGDFKDLFSFNRHAKGQRQIKIAWSKETKQKLQSAREKLKDAQPEETIKILSNLKNPDIDEQLPLLSSRWAKYKQDNHSGVLDSEQKDVAFNRIAKDLLDLIKTIDAQLAEGEKENRKLRETFRERYSKRLANKLASRQQLNLRRFASKEGTSERVADTFVLYNNEENMEEIGKIFQAAHGRMLIVGQPGAGKTTLLLQLADRLFDLEADALPVVINLVSWQSSYRKLETWLEAVLAAELGTNKAGVKAVLRQSEMILLLDGLDELKEGEAMNSCLAAIADFGATPGWRFVITCRIEEYKRVTEDARVKLQIELGPLTREQLEAELTRLEHMTPQQPEALPLLQAIQKDSLLRHAVETPFYFNTSQLLFAGSLPVFSAGDLEGRKAEIKEKFIATALQKAELKGYSSEYAAHWLAFLASQMNKKKKTLFELTDLQYDWLPGKNDGKLFAAFIAVLATWPLSGLTFGLFGGIIGGLCYNMVGEIGFRLVGEVFLGLLEVILLGALIGFLNILIAWLGLKQNTRLASLLFSINYILLLLILIRLIFWQSGGVVSGIIGGFALMFLRGNATNFDTKTALGMMGGILILAALIALIIWQGRDWTGGLIFGLSLGFVLKLIVVIIAGLRGLWPTITTKEQIHWPLKKDFKAILFSGLFLGFIFWPLLGLLKGLAFGLGIVLVIWVHNVLLDENSRFIQILNPYQRLYGSMKVLHFSILQHFHLRYLLYKKGALPLDLVNFLNEMSARHILESEGATWRFRHQIIQNHFSELWTDTK
jgi:DNA replication protein DnaC